MNIKILGTGCSNCKKLEASARQVLGELNMEANVEKITDIAEIMNYGVMSLPALVVDDEVKLAGRIPDIKELKELFSK